MALVMEQMFLWVLVVLGNFVTISLQASSRESDSYVAAVVEYAPVSGATLENKDQIFMQNVANYACFMEEAARQGADIIVFPEVGLASMGVPRNSDGTPSLAFYVPEPGSNPCSDNSSEIAQGLRQLSCDARRHGLYAVVNLPERVNCSGCPCPGFPATVDGEECPSSGAYFHNTNVAFDRTGTIVARYRKFNLFGEPGFVPTPEPEFAVFDTDFGVTFGTFICFDIMFEKPAASLVRNYGVCDFAFPTAWFSEAPFLTAVQTQAAWAYSLDVNLLAAGYNKPEVGSAGSGIFLGRDGALHSIMPNSTTSRLLVGSVPKTRRCQAGSASRGRSRRGALAGDAATPEGEDDDNVAVERTPLSAFHHIVRQRKLGRINADVDEAAADESNPSYIHASMYDQADGEVAKDYDDSGPPSGEYESKVPPHFMGLQQTDETKDDEETKQIAETYERASAAAGDWAERLENAVETEEEEATSDSSSPFGGGQKMDVPEKKIPASTRSDAFDFSEPSQNPDLLRLYQDEPEEQLPEEFLEIEVPEIDEPTFEPERDPEYFKLPEEEEIVLPGVAKGENREESHEEQAQQLLSTEDRDTAAGDSSDLSVALRKETKETEGKNSDAVNEKATVREKGRRYDGQQNATQEEIEAALKKFEWLIEEQNVPSAPSDGKVDEEAPREEHVDDTDDVLGDDNGMHLLDAGEEDKEAPREEEHVDDTDDVLADDNGMHLLDAGEQEKEAPREKEHVDDTDDVLADSHGLAELDVAETDNNPKQEPEDAGKLTEGLQADTLTDIKQRAESKDELKKTEKCRKKRGSFRDRLKGSGRQRKCNPRPEGQKSSTEPAGIITDDKPVVETSESFPEGFAGETKPEQQQEKSEAEVTSSEAKHPSKPRNRRESGCPAFRDGVLDDERVSRSTAGLFLKRDHLEVYKTFTLSTDSLIENSTVLLCDGTFCCEFGVVLEVNAELDQPHYAYRLAVFDGVRTFDGVATGGLQVCAVIPCSRDDLDSCGMLTLPDSAAYATVFRSISISGVFSTNHTLVTANTALPGLEPLPADRFNMTSAPVAEKTARYTLKTSPAVMNEGVSLFTFAIYSRVFKRDGQPVTTLPGAEGDNCMC